MCGKDFNVALFVKYFWTYCEGFRSSVASFFIDKLLLSFTQHLLGATYLIVAKGGAACLRINLTPAKRNCSCCSMGHGSVGKVQIVLGESGQTRLQ